MSLSFRQEALAAQSDSGLGSALLAPTPGARVWVGAAAASAIALAAFAVFGQYTRKEHVIGVLAPESGLIKVVTPQTGTVLRRPVAEGAHVHRGDELLVISSERASLNTSETQVTMLRAMMDRRGSLETELGKQGQIDLLGTATLEGRARALEAQCAQASAQVDLQRSRIASARRSLERNQLLVSDHFLSPAALQKFEDDVTDQQAQLAAAQRNVAALQGDLAQARAEASASRLKRANAESAMRRQMSELDQQITEADSRRTVVLRAPADGTVTGILVDDGQTVSAGTPLLSLLPEGSKLVAQLFVPSRSAGFLRKGQTVALRYQAFAYQRFGHAVGEVSEISRTAMSPNEATLPVPLQEAVYRVVVRLPAQTMQAYGQPMALQAGMALDADVWVDRRRIVEWLFDPLYSITGRV